MSGARLLNPDAESDCRVCLVSSADQILKGFGIEWGMRWWSLGVSVGFVGFNIVAALGIYYLRVGRTRGVKVKGE